MSIIHKIEEYNRRKNQLQTEAQNLKKEFEAVIVNKEIPLLERWKIFINADDDFKNHSDWIHSAQSDGMQYIMDNWFDAPEVYGRGKQIDIADMLCDCVGEEEFYPENFCRTKSIEDAMILLEQALEEILSENLGSFCYDW